MRDKILIVTAIILFSYLCGQTVSGAAGEGQYFFAITDPAGDDYGPGSYHYPTHKDFHPGEGLLDITSFRIGREGQDYLLEFKFRELSDPWVGKFGFSHPLIQLYIDNEEGGVSELFRAGANVTLDHRYPWDHLLAISGWWVRAFRPEDREREDDFWNTGEDPWKVEEARVSVKGRVITVRIRESLLGKLEGAAVFLLVGSFDPFNPDYFRPVAGVPSGWSFSDTLHENLQYAPRVIDLILPPGRDQAALLADFNGSFPGVYPFRVSNNALPGFNLLYLTPLIILLLLILFFMYKKNPFRDTKG